MAVQQQQNSSFLDDHVPDPQPLNFCMPNPQTYKIQGNISSETSSGANRSLHVKKNDST